MLIFQWTNLKLKVLLKTLNYHDLIDVLQCRQCNSSRAWKIWSEVPKKFRSFERDAWGAEKRWSTVRPVDQCKPGLPAASGQAVQPARLPRVVLCSLPSGALQSAQTSLPGCFIISRSFLLFFSFMVAGSLTPYFPKDKVAKLCRVALDIPQLRNVSIYKA